MEGKHQLEKYTNQTAFKGNSGCMLHETMSGRSISPKLIYKKTRDLDFYIRKTNF